MLYLDVTVVLPSAWAGSDHLCRTDDTREEHLGAGVEVIVSEHLQIW